MRLTAFIVIRLNQFQVTPAKGRRFRCTAAPSGQCFNSRPREGATLAKQMMDSPDIGYRASTITLVIGLCGLMNGGGRLFFAWWSDRLAIRKHILIYISLISFLTMAVSLKFAVVIGIALLIINACYGAGFSVIPGILADHYGMSDISKIHGAVLSAWGVAGEDRGRFPCPGQE